MKPKKILICGLPGSGKTHFAEKLKKYLEDFSNISNISTERMCQFDQPPHNWHAQVDWFNADQVRQKYNDWDFSHDGRIRQSLRMAQFALECNSDFVICDFVAPLPEMRYNFKADWTIWMDTIDEGRYEDTNRIFVPPNDYDFRITEKNAEKWVPFVGHHILNNQRRPIFNWQKETALMLGRYQPWHAGHRALFERALTKTGQVVIQVRDCQGWNNSNPFDFSQISSMIRRDLDPFYQGQYQVITVPNITEIVYGRDVGYRITQEMLSDEIHSISATKIRQSMGLE
jgi:hypothetical protein